MEAIVFAVLRSCRARAFWLTLILLAAAPWRGLGQAPLLEGPAAGMEVRGEIVAEWRADAAERALRSGLAVLAEDLYRDVLAAPGLPGEKAARARLRLAAALIHQGRFSDARRELDAISPGDRGPAHSLFLAVTEYGGGDRVDAGALADSLRLVAPGALEPVDRPWFYLMEGLQAEMEKRDERMRQSFERAREAAVSEAQAAFFESLILREEFRATGATEDLAARLRGRMENMEGDPAAFPYVREYAIVLHELGRSAEAIALIERELAGPRGYESREREQLLLLKALVLGGDSLGGRATLRELVRTGQSREVMAIALQMLVRNRGALESADMMRFFDEMIGRSEPHPLLGQLYYMRSQLALALGDTVRAEEDARLLLEQFPGLRDITSVYRLLAYASLRRDPPQYRTAADYLVRLRDATGDPAAQAELNRLIGDCYFVNGDNANAADFYLSARGADGGTEQSDGLFLRLITAEVRAGRIDAALRHIDEADFRGRTPVAERWRAEWNLVQALQAGGETDRALARVRLLLADAGEGGVPAALDLRLRWLEARLSFQVGEREGLAERVGALRARIAALPEAALDPQESRLLVTELMLLQAGILIRTGDAATGLALLQELRNRYADSFAAERSFLTEANHLAGIGDYAGAQEVLSRLAAGYPASMLAPQALFEAALYSERRGPENYAAAVLLLNTLTEDYPGDPLVFFAQLKQGDLLRLMNDFAGARIVYEDLINRQPDHPFRYRAEIARADCMMALAGDEPGQLQDVAVVLERLLELPNLPVDLQVEAAFKWGFALARRGDDEGAREVFTLATSRYLLSGEGVVALGETGRYWLSRLLLDLGTLLEKAGELAEARRVYRKISRHNLPGRQLARARADALLIVDR